MSPNSIQFVFFGTDEFSVIVLDELKKAKLVPALVLTAPDRKKGRGMILTSPPAKLWAQKHRVPLFQPEKLDAFIAHQLSNVNCQLFVVASYGKIIPKEILNIPKHGALNVHPSLLPLYRGPSPIQTQILENAQEVGVTIMRMDEKVDHGPIVAQETLPFSTSHFQFSKLRDELAMLGGKLLAKTIPDWVVGAIDPQEQDHTAATYTKMVTKENGHINLNDNPELNYRKFLAYRDWPSVYFFQNGTRVKITDAELKNGVFTVKKVIPEGGREIEYADFARTHEAQ